MPSPVLLVLAVVSAPSVKGNDAAASPVWMCNRVLCNFARMGSEETGRNGP